MPKLTFATLTFLSQLVALSELRAEIEYPFDLPEKIEAGIEIDSSKKSAINPLLFGLNCNWPENLYGKIGYNHPDAHTLIHSLQPGSLRFPHGVWANFYDWETDGRRMTDDYKTPYDSDVKDHPDLKYGFEGFHKLNEELKFDVLFTYNVNYDSAEKSARRLADRKAKGFDVKWIELGNEIFWKTQRSNAVSDVEKYIAVSKSHAKALRNISPDVKLSVPVHWRNPTTDSWNMALKDQDHFDAITVHKHIGKKQSPDELAAILNVSEEFREMADTLQTVFPNRPIWLSEWSVGCGENAISILGMADAYLGFIERPDQFEMADYFQINASHPLIHYDRKTNKHTRTSYGAAFEIIRGVFEGCEKLAAQTRSTKIGGKIDSVEAAAVEKDGKIVVFAINKTPQRVPFKLVVDGLSSDLSYEHQALSFDDINQLKTFELDNSVVIEIPSDSGLVLPPLSLNRIELMNSHVTEN